MRDRADAGEGTRPEVRSRVDRKNAIQREQVAAHDVAELADLGPSVFGRFAVEQTEGVRKHIDDGVDLFDRALR